MYYKIADHKSVLEYIFKDDFDKIPKHIYENGPNAEPEVIDEEAAKKSD